jgi:drug/metabolite transporter (DMT)-like permease
VLTAVLLALAGACAFAVATVVQHRAATDAAAAERGRWLVRLARRPAWLAAQAAAGLGLVLHAAALRSGPVTLVQPLLATGLVFALALGSWVDRRHPERPRPGRARWLAAGAVAVGLTVFLLAARPSPGTPVARPVGLAVLTVAVLVVAGLATLWARSPGRPQRALVRGAAAGAGFGVTGLLLKQLLDVPIPSWAAAGTAGELAAVAVAAIALSQAAFAAGPLVESLPVITVLEPAVGVLLAGPLFGEALLPGAGARLGQLTGALLLGAGLVLLAKQGPATADGPVPEPFRRRSGERVTVSA